MRAPQQYAVEQNRGNNLGRPKGSKNKPKQEQEAASKSKTETVQKPKIEAAYEYDAKDTAPAASEPMLGRCLNDRNAAWTNTTHLCYNCHKEAEGYVFNEEKKLWIKPKKNKGEK
jgi:hypothetical protein